MKRCYCTVMGVFLVMICSFTVSAQDHHYWTHQFGSRSILMGGAVVGGVRDTSAGFYNPGALGFVDNDSLSVSANGYQLQNMSVPDGAGDGVSLDSSQINNIPLLLSGTHSFEKLPKDVFGYTLMARNHSSMKASARRETYADIIPAFEDGQFAGEEDYVGQYYLDASLTEMWGGLSWARKLNEKIAIGTTLFLAMRNQNQTQSTNVSATKFFDTARSTLYENIDFWNIRGLLKFGMSADFDALKLGLVMTTPSVSLYGKGTIAGEVSSNNVWTFTDETGRKFSTDLVGTDRQEDLDATYKTPFSAAAGIEYTFMKKTTVGFTVEWFAEQSSYDVITPNSNPFVRGIPVLEDDPELNSDVMLKLEDSAEEVINFALGIEHIFTDKIKGYVSFHTDYKTTEDTDIDSIRLGISDWDIYHVTLGAAYWGEGSETSVGITYSFGEGDKFNRPANLSGEMIREGDLIIMGEPNKTSVDYNAWSFILGYTHYFK